MLSNTMARKVFISVLGFSNYGECKYARESFTSPSVRFIQEATLLYLQEELEWNSKDAAYILLTDEAEKANWQNDGHRHRMTGETIKCEGLQNRLQKMDLPFTIQPINHLPHGNNESEIWEIFERVFSQLEEGDELYFDLTHGFRYLPMLVMVLINYSKFLKNTSVKSITYGNYESRNSENIAPIIDLLPLSVLQDWTYAAGQFLDSGNVQRLVRLSNEKIRPILRETEGADQEASMLNKFIKALESSVEDLQTCRGINLVEATNLEKLKRIVPQMRTTFITPLNPIFEKIKDKFHEFTESRNVKNGFIAAKWCVENGLYQQAITILQENIVTMLCLEQNIDFKDENQRSLVNSAFNYYRLETPEHEWSFPYTTKEEIEVRKTIVQNLLRSESLKKLSSSFMVCTNIRNDFNHSGMRQNPSTATKLKMNIKERIDKVMEIIYGA